MTEGPGVGRRAAVAGETLAPLHTAALVAAQRTVAAAVAGAAGPDPRGDAGPLLQVLGLLVQPQRPDAAPEAFLPGRRAPWGGERGRREAEPGVVD